MNLNSYSIEELLRGEKNKSGWPHYILKPGVPGLSSANESYGTTFKLFTQLGFQSPLKRELLHSPTPAPRLWSDA